MHALASCRVMKGSWPPLAPPPGPDRAPMLERSMGALLVVLLRRGSLALMLLRAPPLRGVRLPRVLLMMRLLM